MSPGGGSGVDAEADGSRLCGSLAAEGSSVGAAWLPGSSVLGALTHSHSCRENDVCITAGQIH